MKPVPSESPPAARAPADLPGPAAPDLPEAVAAVLDRLWSNGQAAFVVGGSLRDVLSGRQPTDWDVTTDARPERILGLFPGSRYENRFGTVSVPAETDGAPSPAGTRPPAGTQPPAGKRPPAGRQHPPATPPLEVTTFRRDHTYGDHRRPDRVSFGTSIEEDLARRDFTVNAIAWGRAGDGPRVTDGPDLTNRSPRGQPTPAWLDPWGGMADLEAGLIRAVGEPERRFDEDALRILRAVRLAATLDFRIEERTLAALQARAPDVRFVSSERVGTEFRRLLRARPPSLGLRLLETSGLLEARFGLLAAQRGLAQDKLPGDDLWAHSLRTLDAAAELTPDPETPTPDAAADLAPGGGPTPDAAADLAPGGGPTTADEALAFRRESLALAALLHDIGKPMTLADGHFPGHDEVGAQLATDFLAELALPKPLIERVAALVRHHMFGYTPAWTDAAVRRFLRRVGPDLVEDLFRLREADDIGSGLPPGAGGLGELRARAHAELERGVPLGLKDLAVDGDVLQRELGRGPGPWLGRLLDRLLDSVIADPRRNRRETLLASARAWTQGEEGPPG